METLVYLKTQTNVWFELTTLIIPGENDSDEELNRMTEWVVENLGSEVPMHFSAFHPDWKMMDKPNTPPATLLRARAIAIKNGVSYAYVGNVHHEEGDSTYCPNCKKKLIGRDWYELKGWHLTEDGNCQFCNTSVAGVFQGPPGTWGRKRLPVPLKRFA